MNDHYIKYYPVGNGDTSLISLTDETKIIIDVNITADADDDNESSRYDVRNDLLADLNRDKEDIPFTDVFILTHPDQDHCRGFDHVFYQGDPSNYSDDDSENDLIRIDELWFSPRIFNEYSGDLSDSAKAFKKEAERRLEIYKLGDSDSTKPGNRLRIIGFSDNNDLDGIGDILTVPGSYVDTINADQKDNFRFFVLAPIKEDTDNNDNRNDTSIILQAIFDVNDMEKAVLALYGGDSGWNIWERLIDMNDENKDVLDWDLFLAPHHCSWGFFNDSYDDNPEPKKSSIDVLKRKRDGGIIISSSKKIEDNDDNPPSFPAKQEYEKEAGEKNFLATSEHPNENEPLPIIFRITENGPQKLDNNSNEKLKQAAFTQIGSTPKTYG